jgi:hypothetical protein
LNPNGRRAELFRSSTHVVPSSPGLPTPTTDSATPLWPVEIPAPPVAGLPAVIHHLVQAALVRRTTEAEASIQADYRRLIAEQVTTAEAVSEARVRLAELQLDEQVQLEEIETERSVRGVVRLLPDAEARTLLRQVSERALLLRDCAQVRTPAADIQARLLARADIAAARRRAEAEEAALHLQRRVYGTPGRRGDWLAAAAAERERHLLVGERSRQERLHGDTVEKEVQTPTPASLQWTPSDQAIHNIATSYALLLKGLAPADQERVADVLDELLAPALPPLALAEVREKVEELLGSTGARE